VIYGLGPHPYYGAGQYRRLKGVFLDGGLKVREPSELGGYTLIYRLNPDGTLTARGTAPGKAPGEMTLRRYTIPQKEHEGGTVGAVVRDRCGDLAAGTSTGGFGSKTPGRVGDSPIIGAGTYADNKTAAISATGHGELFMRHVVAYAITAAMKYKGISLEKGACVAALSRSIGRAMSPCLTTPRAWCAAPRRTTWPPWSKFIKRSRPRPARFGDRR
jgi:beta-aspartyl-peptidase (threonine type)